MYREVFQSLNESIKKRNTPDSFLPPVASEKETIHRGYLKTASLPIRYDFKPDGKGGANSGTHAYVFKDKDRSGIVEISFRHAPSMSGHETSSKISYEMVRGDPLEDIDAHRIIIPILKHHLKSHAPDSIQFNNTIPFQDDLIRRMGDSFDEFEKQTKDGVVKIAKRILDPKIGRIVSHIKNKLNNNRSK